MSRIGRLPVELPGSVKAEFRDGELTIEGPKGKLHQAVPDGINVIVEDKRLRVERKGDTRQSRALHGLIRSLANNMVIGVMHGYSKTLWGVGVGYGAKKQGNKLSVQVGYAHDVLFEIPKGIEVSDITSGSLPSGSRSIPMAILTGSGPDKQMVGQLAASIRSSRRPEPYQGKGVRYANEHIRRKAGKRFGAGG